ncbi:hypothetical protein DNR46_34090 [Mesorhizobium japonicum]|uniref:Uncharacterized protein n=1 Tax=Mesorhizobium japonicum TaxID=2066070 RepID=A0A3M9X014_9HYPH|nr:hypothetical protein DNR46_34090 [Mesorhizobium japonicum]
MPRWAGRGDAGPGSRNEPGSVSKAGFLPFLSPAFAPYFVFLEGRLLAMFQSLSAQKLDVQHKSPVERVIFSMLRRYKQ